MADFRTNILLSVAFGWLVHQSIPSVAQEPRPTQIDQAPAPKTAAKVFGEPMVARVELNGRAEVAFNNRGYNYQQLGKFIEASADFKNAIELTPEYALAHQNLGWLLSTCKDESMRDPKAANVSSTKACELNQFNDLSDLAALAASHASAKEFDLAIGIQEKIVERASPPQKPLAEKLLELYRNEKPFDPDLKVEPAPESNASADSGPTRP